MTAGHNPSVTVLAACFAGLSMTDVHEEGMGADRFDEPDARSVSAVVYQPSGDRFRITVEWLKEESP